MKFQQKTIKPMKYLKVQLPFNIIVLIDFTEGSYRALKYAISLAKLINCKIKVFHALETNELNKIENTHVLSMELDSEIDKIKNKLNAIIEIISEEGVEASYHYTIGKKDYKIQEWLEYVSPDLVVIGKKIGNPKFGGRLTGFLVKKYNGSLLIVDGENLFKPKTRITLGCKQETLKTHDPYMVLNLHFSTDAPLTILNVGQQVETQNTINFLRELNLSDEKNRNLQYVCQKSRKVNQGLIQHIQNNNVELLCLGRKKQNSSLLDFFFQKSAFIFKIGNKTNIPILLMGSQ